MHTDTIDLKDLRSGNRTAFSELVKQYHIPMVHMVRPIIGEALAEEVVQEAWVSAYKALPKFEGRSSLKTWLFTIASNQAKTRLRKEKRSVSLDELQPENTWLEDRLTDQGTWKTAPQTWGIDSPDALLEEDQLRKCIEHTLTILPSMQKAVFTLRDLEQMSLGEICNNLDISDSNVRVLLHRARAKLMQVVHRYQETGQC